MIHDCRNAAPAFLKWVRMATPFWLVAFIICLGSLAHAAPLGKYLEEDEVEEDQCLQAWPVDCEASGGGGTGCGGWSILENLAQPEQLPGTTGNTCSTGVRISMGAQSEGQAVGAMFPGIIIFSQAGLARDGKDYGGVVVVQLQLRDGSPQCYARYMFLDRRDLVVTGKAVKAGQRIGSVASNDMNATRDWWQRNWPNWQPQVKIDIGCDEALANLPHFMPKEPFVGPFKLPDGKINPHSCPLTKIRFPTPPLHYLTKTEHGGNVQCHVGVRKDARPKLTKAKAQDDTEKNLQITGHYVTGVKARGIIKRKETPVFAVFSSPIARDTLFGANHQRRGGTGVYRDHANYNLYSTLGCKNMGRLLSGKDKVSLTPEEARELINHCTNQFVLGASMFPKVYDRSQPPGMERYEPVLPHLQQFMRPEDLQRYNELKTQNMSYRDILNTMQGEITKVMWRDQCQPLHMEEAKLDKDYYPDDILEKAWKELLIDWPMEQKMEPISRKPMKSYRINVYTSHPYERINDPSSPFSPRHIFAETDRERYKEYALQCAATPVDIIMGAYGDHPDVRKYSLRDDNFHKCSTCRIQVNDSSKKNKGTCIADPYSFTNLGGCQGSLAGANGVPVILNNNDIVGALMWEEFDGKLDGQGGARTASGEVMYQDLNQGAMLLTRNVGPMNEIIKEKRGTTIESYVPEYKCSWADTTGGNDKNPIPADKPTTDCFRLMGAHSQLAIVTDLNSKQAQFVNLADRGVSPYTSFSTIKSDLQGQVRGIYRAPLQGTKLPYAGEGTRIVFENFGQKTFYYSALGRMGAGNITGKGVGIKLLPPNWKCNPDLPANDPKFPGINRQFTPLDGGICTNTTPPGFGISAGNVNGTLGGLQDLLGTADGQGVTAGVIGSFDPAACPETYPDHTYTNQEFAFDGGNGRKCPPFSYPTPDFQETAGAKNPGAFGCFGRTFSPRGPCSQYPASCVDMTNACSWIRSGSTPSKNEICASGSCPPILHEGMDLATRSGTETLGYPIYASAAGKVEVQSSGYLIKLDHSGECINPLEPASTCKKFPAGVQTMYIHMGPERIMVKDGQRVQRCQQIATVGNMKTEHAAHLHYEVIDPNNKIMGGKWNTYGLGQEERFHAHLRDRSCSGGIFDPKGLLGQRGICEYALAVDTTDKKDLTPPDYYTDYKKAPFTPIQMPDPPSEKVGDPFKLDEPGMVYNGAWRYCKNLDGKNRERCDEENKKPEVTQGGITGGSKAFINPLPCAIITAPFGQWRGTYAHHGLDMAEPQGTPMFAAADGIVEHVGSNNVAGNNIRLRHADGSKTRYLHIMPNGICSQVAVGATVKQGQVIAKVGTTGNSTGPHLHFETYTPNLSNPQSHIPAQLNRNSAQCKTLQSMDCCANPPCPTANIPTGPGIGGGSTGKKLCIDHPCTTRYDEADTIAQCGFSTADGGCGTFGHFSQRADGATAGDCCFNLTQPVASLNILKVRPGYDNEVKIPYWQEDATSKEMEVRQWVDAEGGWQGQRLQEEGGDAAPSDANQGAAEGYTFYELFRDHRPYMRWWDTGAESTGVYQDQTSADNDFGSKDALVGVGIEKNNCGIGGWGEEDKIDNNSSWMELKLYQSRSTQRGFRCLARYEKMFKHQGPEEHVLGKSGGSYYLDMGEKGLRNMCWPLGWRGYASENEGAYRFPYHLSFPDYDPSAHGGLVGGGLDYALAGDILVWDKDVTQNERLPHVAYVVHANNAIMREGDGSLGGNPAEGANNPIFPMRWFDPAKKSAPIDWLVISDFNYGKYPDACGTTNWAEVGANRTVYKPGHMPPDMWEDMQEQGAPTKNCADPDILHCEETMWDRVKIYRPRQHVRDQCQ